MALASSRIPHLFPPRTLARLLAPTYAAGLAVDEEEAHERLVAALAAPALVDELHGAISAAVEAQCGPRTPLDRLLDRLSKGLEKRGGNVRPAPGGAGMAAVLVRVNLELGLAPEPMRATLATPRGSAALHEGLQALGAHLVKELLR